MGQIIGIDTYVELQQHAVKIAVDGLTSGKSTIHGIVTHIIQTGAAFGCDDVTRAQRELATGWNLGTGLKGKEFKDLSDMANEMFLDGIIQGKPIGKNAVEIVQLAAIWGRDIELARKARIEDVRARDAGLVTGHAAH
jgi:hypothetical protein